MTAHFYDTIPLFGTAKFNINEETAAAGLHCQLRDQGTLNPKFIKQKGKIYSIDRLFVIISSFVCDCSLL